MRSFIDSTNGLPAPTMRCPRDVAIKILYMNESREGAVLSAETNVQDMSESTESGGT